MHKNQAHHQQQPPEPRVGIFWLFDGKLIIDSTPLSNAVPYGNALTHAVGHIDHWSALQRRGVVPFEVEYEEPPRGRVGYDKRDERFFLRADKCIRGRKSLVRQVMAVFYLPPERTIVDSDDHYRCAVCLRRLHRGQD